MWPPSAPETVAAPLGLKGEAASQLGCPTTAPHCLACAKEGRPIAASHHPGACATQKSALMHQKSALELEMHQMLISSEAVLEGGARPRTCMCMTCTRHVHGMRTACARHAHGMCTATPRPCTAYARRVRRINAHVALHMHQASAPRRAYATRAGSPRTLERCSRPWRRCDR